MCTKSMIPQEILQYSGSTRKVPNRDCHPVKPFQLKETFSSREKETNCSEYYYTKYSVLLLVCSPYDLFELSMIVME